MQYLALRIKQHLFNTSEHSDLSLYEHCNPVIKQNASLDVGRYEKFRFLHYLRFLADTKIH